MLHGTGAWERICTLAQGWGYVNGLESLPTAEDPRTPALSTTEAILSRR